MRYKAIPDGDRFKVVDTEFHDTLICHTGSKQKAHEMTSDLSERFGNAPRPVALQTFQKTTQADASERRAQLIQGDASVEKSMSQSDWIATRRATRGESCRIDDAA